ncbi:MAG: alpha-ketoglutarate-dependent dioxygenase AlkB [Leptospirales bacterium]
MKLPVECQVDYHKGFLTSSQSSEIFNWIYANCEVLEGDKILMGDGTVFKTNIGKYMFVDQELTDSSIFKKEHGRRMKWPPVLIPLRDKIESFTGVEFGVCVCIYYSSGKVGLGFHSDLRAFGPTSLIPSISLGAKRTLVLRKRSNPSDECRIELGNGDLLIMGKGCQEDYEHSVPPDEDCKEPRINLTFRPFAYLNDHKSYKRIM